MSDTGFRMPFSWYEPRLEEWFDCPECGGKGGFERGRDEFGVWDVETCPRCEGTGEIERSEL